MSQSLHIVFSQPPAGVTDAEFNRWYDAHLHEILTAPGFVAARRFRLDPVEGDHPDPPFRFLTVYEIEGDPDAAVSGLEAAGFGTKDSYAALKEVDSGILELPDWFERARFASWNCIPLGDRVEQAS